MNQLYKPTWNSLRCHQVPQWFQNAKFGIYTHWGVYSVPGFGPDGSWYPYFMYRPGTKAYQHHVKHYGGPEKFGYKDFIPDFTGDLFDADEWAEIFKSSGAQYAGPVAEHHDGFCMWDSNFTEWKATSMGPKRDVVGELADAIRKQDMCFMVALHHAENWWFYPHWVAEYDTSDPTYSGLYGEAHDYIGEQFTSTDPEDTWPHEFFMQFSKSKPSKAFLDQWKGKTCEVVDKYFPDMIWFDFGLKGIQEHYKREAIAYYYNQAQAWGKDVLVTYKMHDLVPVTGVVDLELRRYNELTYQIWLTDNTVDDGRGWAYLKNQKYKDTRILVHYLIDIVSKNGNLLLNVGPKPNGEIPEEAKTILFQMGEWLNINGEAIYGTTPWMIFGEGPTKNDGDKYSRDYGEKNKIRYTARDFRFTAKDDILYASCLGIPKGKVLITSLSVLYESEIKSVQLLGINKYLGWSISPEGLEILLPNEQPCDYAFVFKIERKMPYK